MKRKMIFRLVLSAMFLALGLVLPLLTGQIPNIGKMLLPMHIPVMLCGLICGPWFGLAVGAILPIFRSFLFGMPVMYPDAVCMALELATYGFVIGLVYMLLQKINIFRLKPMIIVNVYISLITAMLLGRVVWGVAKAILLGLGGKSFTWAMFIAGGFTNALPGIILQLVLIPLIMIFIERKKLFK